MRPTLFLASALAWLGCPGTPNWSRARELEQSGSLAVGTPFVVRTRSPRGVSPEFRAAWPDAPTITGDAITFVGHVATSPPDDEDGGATVHSYRFLAAKPGVATLAVRPTSRGSGAAGPVELQVTVLDR